MDSDIALYTLEQIINQEMTCVTTDRTQYKGVLLHMYRNLDCMLGNTEVKYLDKRIEQRETVFIRGTKIIFFILPESALAIISARVEEELAKETIKGLNLKLYLFLRVFSNICFLMQVGNLLKVRVSPRTKIHRKLLMKLKNTSYKQIKSLYLIDMDHRIHFQDIKNMKRNNSFQNRL